MTMNAKSIGPVVTATVLGGVPAGVMIGAARHANKTIGAPASVAHVLTNDKLDSKAKVIAETEKEGIKDTLTLGGIAVGAGAAASLATGCSKKLTAALHNLKHMVGDKLSQVSISKIPANVKFDTIIFDNAEQVKYTQNLKDIIKNSKIYTKLNALPTPAKAGLAVAAATLALAAPIVALVSAQKAGYIEGQHEVK